MFTKTKLAIVLCGTLIAGVASAQPAGQNGNTNPKWGEMKQKREEMRKQALEKFDLDHNGKLDEKERAAMRDQRLETVFAKLDTNKDGQISLAEFKAGKLGKMARHGVAHHRGGRSKRGGVRRGPATK